MMKHITILFVVALMPVLAHGETVREITISADKPYTDNLSLAHESGDMDVMIKFSFDEQNDQLTVSMTSYRGLFVFHDNVAYKPVVKCSRLKVKKLPYVVTGEEVPYKMLYSFRKQLGNHRSKFVFRRWMNYTGLLPEPMEYKMVNDVISQKFGIVGEKRTSASVTIGDVMIMEPKIDCCKKPYYDFLHFCRVDTRYNITIERDPCFAMEEQISVASQQKTAVLQGLESLRSTFPNHSTSSKEIHDLFVKTKDMLVQQFPKRDTVSECPKLQALNDSFNIVVDSINAYSVKFVTADTAHEVANPYLLLSIAYQLDMKVSRWQLTTDPVERADIIRDCNAKIDEANLYIRRVGLHTKEMREANRIVQNAINYYKTTCHIRKQ